LNGNLKDMMDGFCDAMQSNVNFSAEEWAAQPVFPVPLENVRGFLEEGLKQFRQGAELKDGGRAGMETALFGALFMLGSQLIRHRDQELLEPLVTLVRALRDLERGSMHPAFVPRRAGRPAAGWEAVEFKGRCLAAADLLYRNMSEGGRLSRSEADLAITRRMQEAAVRLGVTMTRKSLATWRRDGRKGANKDGLPTTLFGFWVQAAQSLATDLRDQKLDLETQISSLLDPVSGAHLSHLPIPGKNNGT
jgi:hypothetical protein